MKVMSARKSPMTVIAWGGFALLSVFLAANLPDEIGWVPTLFIIAIVGSFALLVHAADSARGID